MYQSQENNWERAKEGHEEKVDGEKELKEKSPPQAPPV